jgi:hypothetical protein
MDGGVNMSNLLLKRLIQDEKNVPEQSADLFTYTYFAFLDYFHRISIIDVHQFIIGANFTYGWMPTMLRLKSTQFEAAAEDAAQILNHAKRRENLTDQEYQLLIDLMNRSIVGVSKLLHFVNPQDYAIWDSRVAAYLNPAMSSYQFQRTATYRSYLEQCAALCAFDEFAALHQSVNHKVGRPVTPFRAIELVMYTNGRSN